MAEVELAHTDNARNLFLKTVFFNLSFTLPFRTGGTHSAKDKILGVMAMDMKLNTVRILLSELFPTCDDVDKS